jgi:hemerythrin-like metal-binding protein
MSTANVSDLDWTSELSVGLALTDADHVELLEQLRDLHDAVEQRASGDDVLFALDTLIEYTCLHFRDEERLMAAVEYALLAEHIVEHERLVLEAMGVRARYLAGDATVLDANGLRDLRAWLTGHIVEDDKLVGEFVRAQQQAQAQQGCEA